LENWIPISRILKLNLYLLHIGKINSKWIKYSTSIPEYTHLEEENKGKCISSLEWARIYYGQSPKVQVIKAKIPKWITPN
jgi:hypothetical protein